MSSSERQQSHQWRRNLAGCSDEDLVTLVAEQHDEQAFAEIYRRYGRRVYLWCYRYTHQADEAVDCAQEVFLRIFRGLDGFRRDARLSTWIYGIARNYCLGLLAQRGRDWRRRLEELDGQDPVDDGQQRLWSAFEQADEVGRLLDAAGRRMEPREIEAFVLHYREGLTVKEITRTLGCENITGARTLIQNARRKFRRLVAREEFGHE